MPARHSRFFGSHALFFFRVFASTAAGEASPRWEPQLPGGVRGRVPYGFGHFGPHDAGAVGFEQQLYGLLDHLPRFLEILALADRAGKLRHLGQDPTVFELLINDRELGTHRGLTAQLAVCMKL